MELGRLVTEGRRREFARFADFGDPTRRARIPDPQADATFHASRLVWEERDVGDHGATLRLHRALLALRREVIVPRRRTLVITAPDPDVILMTSGDVAVVVRLAGRGTVALPALWASRPRVRFTTEDPAWAASPEPAVVDAREPGVLVTFGRPGALVLTSG